MREQSPAAAAWKQARGPRWPRAGLQRMHWPIRAPLRSRRQPDTWRRAAMETLAPDFAPYFADVFRLGGGDINSAALSASENCTQIFIDRQNINVFTEMNCMYPIVGAQKRKGSPVCGPGIGRTATQHTPQQGPVEHDGTHKRHHRLTTLATDPQTCQPLKFSTISRIADVAVPQNNRPESCLSATFAMIGNAPIEVAETKRGGLRRPVPLRAALRLP